MSDRREFSKAVKVAAWKRCKGHCEGCTAPLFRGRFDYHHDKEDTFGGEPTLENCKVLCDNCHLPITRARARVIAKSNRVRNRHIGIKRQRSSFATNKDGPFRKRMDGTVERR
jgi:5-methylcytosine-specific restriction enzyme A